MKNIPTPVDNTFWETRPSIPLNSRAEWDQVKYNERPYLSRYRYDILSD